MAVVPPRRRIVEPVAELTSVPMGYFRKRHPGRR